MAAKILDGKACASEILDSIKSWLDHEESKPILAIITIGDDAASEVYVRNKKKAAEQCGIEVRHYSYAADAIEEQVINDLYNIQCEVDGIIVQLPLPNGWNEDKILSYITPFQDVDGFTEKSLGAGVRGQMNIGYRACTPKGIMLLLQYYNISPRGKNVVIVGRSNIVGKPLAMEMLCADATVTICHSKTKNLKQITKQADILITAIGKANYFDKSYIKRGAAVIDVGINRDDNNKLCGDCNFKSMQKKASYITPVPGGVGPMTVAALMENTYYAFITK